MFNRYFQQELANLKELGAEFSRKHPAVAPMLSGLSADPDVERLLEGVAFLTALLRQKLDDDFPEIIHELFQLIWPHFLRPIPAATMVAFKPKAALKQPVQVKRGTLLASVPVEGTTCHFKTCYQVDVQPLSIESVSAEQRPGQPPCITLGLKLQGLELNKWQARHLRFHLAGDYPRAADTFFLLLRHLSRIVLKSENGSACILPPESLQPVGMGADEALLPYPAQSFPAYRILQEYLVLPEKYLFVELSGLERWQNRGGQDNFEIVFELEKPPFDLPRLGKKDFVLFATPAINIFEHDAEPVRIDHKRQEYLVRPAGSHKGQYQVYAVDAVTGFSQGTARERAFMPFELFAPRQQDQPVFHTRIQRSPIRPGFDFFISVVYPPGQEPLRPETLSIRLRCTNGFLPESLQVGDICRPTSSSPEMVAFTNIRPPTSNILPPLGRNLLWHLVSHLCLNYRSLASAENLKALLNLYNFEENRDRPAFLANQKRIEGIQAVSSRPEDRLVDGVIMRGRAIDMELRQDHYAGPGDLFLFGTVLDSFFGAYAAINSFTRLVIKETLKGVHYKWPARIGDQILI